MKSGGTRRNLFQSIFFTLLSRIIGFFRTMVETMLLGLSLFADGYQASFRLTNFFREVFGEGALGGVFTPMYQEIEEEEGQESARQFFWCVFLTFSVLGLIFSALIFVFSEEILTTWLKDFQVEQSKKAVEYTKIMAPYLWFIAMASCCMLLHQIQGRFIFSSIHPVLFSVSVILFGYFGGQDDQGLNLSYGVLTGGFAQFLALFLTAKSGLPKFEKIKEHFHHLARLLRLLVPVFFALVVQRLNRLVDLYFASGLPFGTVAALAYSVILINVPLGILAVASNNVFYPVISKLKAQKNNQGLNEQIESAVLFLLRISLPFWMVALLYHQEAVQTLFLIIPKLLGFETKLTLDGARLLSECLLYYLIPLPVMILLPLYVRLFHAHWKTRIPALISAIAVVINIVLNLLLVERMAHKGIALASSMTVLFSFAIYSVLLNAHGIYTPTLKVLKQLLLRFGLLILTSAIFHFLVHQNAVVEVFLWCFVYFCLEYLVQWYFNTDKRQ